MYFLLSQTSHLPSGFVSFAQIVCMWLPTSAAEVVERIVQSCASGPGVHGADVDCSLSCHVSSLSPILSVFWYRPLAMFISHPLL